MTAKQISGITNEARSANSSPGAGSGASGTGTGEAGIGTGGNVGAIYTAEGVCATHGIWGYVIYILRGYCINLEKAFEPPSTPR